jgi:hypothetical protein
MNNNVTLEQIDKVLERFPNISYAEAKEALLAVKECAITPVAEDSFITNPEDKYDLEKQKAHLDIVEGRC